MREIIFRGKAVIDFEIEQVCMFLEREVLENGNWIQGDLIWNNGIPFIVHGVIEVNNEYISLEWWMPVDPETVGQYTGLKDKNGFTKIFEGDIIRLDGTIGGNIYEEKELLKDTINLIIKGMGTSSWATTEQEAIMRGCHYAE